MNKIEETMGEILDILDEKDYIRQKIYNDSIFILAKYESVFNKIIEIAKEKNIVHREALNYKEQINPHPFDDIGAYNIALYDMEKVNNIFNDIKAATNENWDIYTASYYWRSGVLRTIRTSTLDSLNAEMEQHDFSLLNRYIDQNKIKIDKRTYGPMGGLPIVLRIINVEEEEKKEKELKEKNKEVDEFIKNLDNTPTLKEYIEKEYNDYNKEVRNELEKEIRKFYNMYKDDIKINGVDAFCPKHGMLLVDVIWNHDPLLSHTTIAYLITKIYKKEIKL